MNGKKIGKTPILKKLLKDGKKNNLLIIKWQTQFCSLKYIAMIKKELVQIENISVEELTEIIAEKLVNKLETRIATLITTQNDEELLTRAETAEFLKINSTTLWHWTKKGKVTAYGIGNRVYYKRGELKKALIQIN